MPCSLIFRQQLVGKSVGYCEEIEHGNEEFRRKVVNRVYSNKKAIEQTKILQSYDVQCGLANIVGFPGETPELHMDIVRINRIIQPDSANCSQVVNYNKC